MSVMKERVAKPLAERFKLEELPVVKFSTGMALTIEIGDAQKAAEIAEVLKHVNVGTKDGTLEASNRVALMQELTNPQPAAVKPPVNSEPGEDDFDNEEGPVNGNVLANETDPRKENSVAAKPSTARKLSLKPTTQRREKPPAPTVDSNTVAAAARHSGSPVFRDRVQENSADAYAGEKWQKASSSSGNRDNNGKGIKKIGEHRASGRFHLRLRTRSDGQRPKNKSLYQRFVGMQVGNSLGEMDRPVRELLIAVEAIMKPEHLTEEERLSVTQVDLFIKERVDTFVMQYKGNEIAKRVQQFVENELVGYRSYLEYSSKTQPVSGAKPQAYRELEESSAKRPGPASAA